MDFSDVKDPVLLVCCFCDHVREDSRTRPAHNLWEDSQGDRVAGQMRPQNAMFVYSCCRKCLTDDPRAIAFRTRRSQSGSSIPDTRESPRRSLVASEHGCRQTMMAAVKAE